MSLLCLSKLTDAHSPRPASPPQTPSAVTGQHVICSRLCLSAQAVGIWASEPRYTSPKRTKHNIRPRRISSCHKTTKVLVLLALTHPRALLLRMRIEDSNCASAGADPGFQKGGVTRIVSRSHTHASHEAWVWLHEIIYSRLYEAPACMAFVLVRCLELFSRNVGMTGHLFWPMWRARIVHLADKNAYAVTEGGSAAPHDPPLDPPLQR